MKKIFISPIFFVFIFLSVSLAQSDFRVTQEFKSKQRSFEIAIEYAKSISELEKIKREISEFRSEYRGSKDLLNKALYPENFESSFKILAKKIRYTNKKLTEITTLARNVSKLEQDNVSLTGQLADLTKEVSALRSRNSNLMAKLNAFKDGYGGSREAIDSLNYLIADLRSGISQRDTLIKEIMDNIFMTADHRVENLDNTQLEGLKGKIQNTSLIENIRSLVDDNVNFLNSSTLNKKDLTELRNEFNDFDARWNHFGPKLFSIYAKDQSNNEKLLEIDSLISGWDNTLNVAIWNSIHELFNSHDITLDKFKSGSEFEQVAIDFINNEINNPNGGKEVAKDQKYIFFAERVWNDEIKKNWLPLLLTNKLFSEQQQQNIELKIAEWEENIGSSKSYLIYGVIILLALLIAGSLFFISKRNKNNVVDNLKNLEDEIIEVDLGSSDNTENDKKV
ncbi:MAG: hypothetical protein GY936_10620 [Ignavibacteriae bacterium]|nr:hypothetical protein [Ignavibacteriota bacterium]